MPVKEKLQVRDLRVRNAAMTMHKRIKKYVGRVIDSEDRDISKEEAIIELLDQALNSKGI